jgi:hypothetical protein
MYVVSTDHFKKSSNFPRQYGRHKNYSSKKTTKYRKDGKQYPHDKWVAIRTKMREGDIGEAAFINKIAHFLHKVLPDTIFKKGEKIKTLDVGKQTPQP